MSPLVLTLVAGALVAGAVVAGAVTGLVLGGLGGGGVLAVPAPTCLFGLSPAAAISAGLIVVTVTSVTALAGHARAVPQQAGPRFSPRSHTPAPLKDADA